MRLPGKRRVCSLSTFHWARHLSSTARASPQRVVRFRGAPQPSESLECADCMGQGSKSVSGNTGTRLCGSRGVCDPLLEGRTEVDGPRTGGRQQSGPYACAPSALLWEWDPCHWPGRPLWFLGGPPPARPSPQSPHPPSSCGSLPSWLGSLSGRSRNPPMHASLLPAGFFSPTA